MRTIIKIKINIKEMRVFGKINKKVYNKTEKISMKVIMKVMETKEDKIEDNSMKIEIEITKSLQIEEQ